MNAPRAHLGERLQDLVDGRLSGAELAQAREHLEGCARCRAEVAALQQVRRALAPRPGEDRLPDDLAARLARALDDEVAHAPQATGTRRRPRAIRRWALAAGVAAAIAASLLLWYAPGGGRADPWTASVVRDFTAYRSARLPLALRSDDPAALERFFAEQSLGFHTRVFDLAMMDYRIEGGEVSRVGDRPSALYVYRGPGDTRLLCEMFRGRIDELPPAAHIARHNGIDFRVYRQGTLTAVYWPEGDIICVLVSDIGSDAVLALAFAKAAPAT